MLSLKDIFDKFQRTGDCSFATLNGAGGVDSRIAQFFAYDDDGLYLRTMTVKPFYRQMVEGGKLAVSGEWAEGPTTWDENNMPHFQPGYMIRVSGDVRALTPEETAKKIKDNPMFDVAAHDMEKYPETCVLVLHSAWGEWFQYDFNRVHMDHKLLRERFGWGGATWEDPGLSIDGDKCIECGSCEAACTYNAIIPGEPYSIRGSWCDECGNCWHVCPADAVRSKGGD